MYHLPLEPPPPPSHPTSLGHHRARAELPVLYNYSTCFLFYTCVCVCMCAQSCPTFCDSIVWELSGSFLHGIFQARIVEWFAISYSRGSSRPRNGTYVSSISWIGRWIFFTMALPGKSEVHCWRLGFDLKKCCTWFVEKEMATHSSILAWRIPETEEPGGLLSMESHKVRHDWSDLAAAAGLIYEDC